MKHKHTVAIAGAGIAGITAAFFAAKKGQRVILIESAHQAGGLLTSAITPFGAFDCGTHVCTFTGTPPLDDFLFAGLQEKNFNFFNPGNAGNYYAGALSEVSPYVDARMLGGKLIQQAENELLNVDCVSSNAVENLEELMIARFGPTIYREILSGVVNKFMGCNANLLSPESINLFDMNRVLAFDAATSEKLKTEARYNESLGFHGAHRGAQKLYPRVGGMGYWIDFLMRKLKEVGVTFMGNSTIRSLTFHGDRVCEVEVDGTVIEIEQLIWSVSPALFSRLTPTMFRFPVPKFRRMALYDYSFEKPLNSNCYYINDYDTSRLSSRTTLYSNLTSAYRFHNCTVEVLGADNFDFDGAAMTVLEELRSSGLLDADNPCIQWTIRAVNNGFPVPELNYTHATLEQLSALEKNFDNVCFIGRSPNRFFMKDVLEHTYRAVSLVEPNAT